MYVIRKHMIKEVENKVKKVEMSQTQILSLFIWSPPKTSWGPGELLSPGKHSQIQLAMSVDVCVLLQNVKSDANFTFVFLILAYFNKNNF